MRLFSHRGTAGLLLLVAGLAQAEPKGGADANLREVLRKAQGVLHQLTEQKAALEAEKATLQSEKTALEDKVKNLEASLHKLEVLPAQVEQCKASIESLQTSKTTLESQISQGRDQAQALLQKQRDIVAKARAIQDDNQLLVDAVKEREQWINQCGERNKALLQANGELLEKYKDKGLWERVGDLEPFTGLGKVQTENAAEEYRYKLYQLKSTPFQPTMPTPSESAPTADTPPAGAGVAP